MNNLDSHGVYCPYCGEPVELLLDYSIPSQQYTEDCPVCCQPMLITVHYEADQAVQVKAQRENE